MTKCDGCYSRVAEGNNPYVSNPAHCVREFGQLKNCARSTALWLPSRHCRARISQNPISLSNLTPTAARPAIPLVIWLIRRKCKMGNGWHEWPLVIFTVLGQCVVGALIVSGIGWFAAKNDADRQHIIRGMFFLWLLMGIGFIASVMHTGSPLRAFNSLNRIGASGLSNEIAAGSIFLPLADYGGWWRSSVKCRKRWGNSGYLSAWHSASFSSG